MNMTAIAIVALVCWAIVELVNGPRAKKRDKLNKQDTQTSNRVEEEISALKERIETLEKIVTDEKYDLNRQFDDLKKGKVA